MDLLSLIARNFIVMEGTMSSPLNASSDNSILRSPREHYVPLRRRKSLAMTPTKTRETFHRSHSVSDISEKYSRTSYDQVLDTTSPESSLTELKDVSWSEYTARKSLVKFRNRHSAAYRSRDQFGGLPPSKMAVRILCNQYEICRNQQTPVRERIMAVFYCWFFGWITDVYSFLTYGCAEKSFIKWTVSSLMVTFGATFLVGLVCVAAHGLLIFLSKVLHSAISFVTFLVVIYLLTIGLITVFSYSKFHYTGGRSSTRVNCRTVNKTKYKRLT